MKKILLVATVQSHICQFHRPLVQMLRENGEFEIHVAARNNLAEKNGLKLDFADKVYDIPFQRSPFNLRNYSAYQQLKKVIDGSHYDYIHCNTPVGGVVTRLTARKARKKGTKVFYTAHGFHFYKGAPKKNWMLYYPLERFLARWTDTLITINEEDYRLAKKKFSCPVARIHGTGADPMRYKPADADEVTALKQKLGLPQDGRYILCVGELLPNKNQKMAIQAMESVIREYPDAVLLIAGNGPERENLEALVREKQLENHVRFLGYCLNLEEYQRASLLSISCSKREGLPLNIIEAMLTGNPVIATRNRGHCELIEDGKTGFLISADDSEGLAKRMTELLNDPMQISEMGGLGYQKVYCYTSQCVKKEWKAVYFE